jgi:hypothetical protein
MKDYKEKSLLDALSFCDLRQLPEEDKKEFIWVRALGLVEKVNGTSNYVVLRANSVTDYSIIKDFGSTAAIVRVTSVYPYEFLDSKFLPDFKGAKKEERINWLLRNGVQKNLTTLSIKELDKECANLAINKQIKQG